MEPGEFIKVLDENGQIPGMIGEVARGKALASVLSKAKVVDTDGKPVDISAFVASASAPDEEGDDFDTSEAADLLTQANDHSGHDHGTQKDSHGRKPGHEHYGHDHK